VAMFLVGGGILVHGWPALHHGIGSLTAQLPTTLTWLGGALVDAGVGIVAGAVVLLAWLGMQKLRRR
jgi:uncharacterized protein